MFFDEESTLVSSFFLTYGRIPVDKVNIKNMSWEKCFAASMERAGYPSFEAHVILNIFGAIGRTYCLVATAINFAKQKQ